MLSLKSKLLPCVGLFFLSFVDVVFAANDDGNEKGSAPNVVAKDKSGTWSDLPRPDESWAKLPGQEGRKVIWNLTTEEQNKILKARGKTASMIGSFYEFNNLLYCAHEPFIMTTSVEASKTPLQGVHIKDYKPTNAELFETMARQTQTSLKYDPTFLSKWIAVPPAMPLPYSVKVAPDWTSEDRGMYVGYHPKIQPVGMDIYMLGRYSDLPAERVKSVLEENAMGFAKMLDKSASINAMKELKVDDCDALYFETNTPRPGCKWRQWSLYKNGQAFLIVSTIDGANESKLLPEVQSMVASFHVLDTPSPSPGI